MATKGNGNEMTTKGVLGMIIFLMALFNVFFLLVYVAPWMGSG